MTSFQLDPAFSKGSSPLATWPLCEVRLQDDARWPWLILLPRIPGATEIEDLAAPDRARLMGEIVWAGAGVRAMGEAAGTPVEKLNVGALGNVTAQLHIHVVGRRRGDPAWPGPVWGIGEAQPYDAPGRARMRDAAVGAARPA